MTAASAWLGWMDPSVEIPEEILSADQLMARTKALVTDNVDINTDRWVDVGITSGPSVLSVGRSLTASAETDQPHFYVDEHGQVFRGNRWRNQKASGDEPGAIQIRVTSRGEGQPMTVAQWAGLRALISVLNENVSDTPVSLPVYLEDTWCDIYGLEPGAAVQIDPLTPSPSDNQ